jgi:hypothetical protein
MAIPIETLLSLSYELSKKSGGIRKVLREVLRASYKTDLLAIELFLWSLNLHVDLTGRKNLIMYQH